MIDSRASESRSSSPTRRLGQSPAPFLPPDPLANGIHPARGLPILLARISRRYYKWIFPLCHHFARRKTAQKTNPSTSDRSNPANSQKTTLSIRILYNGGDRRQIRPTRQPERLQTRLGWHRTAALTAFQSRREEILSGLLANKHGEAQISTVLSWRDHRERRIAVGDVRSCD
jgi:hypothetical protein